VIDPTPDDAIHEIRALVDVGIEHFQPVFQDMATLRREEVIPAPVAATPAPRTPRR
jgi:hypothetical protein